jgi:hypothetical protein
MTRHDAEKFSALMVTLGMTFNREIEPKLIRIYWDALVDFGIDEIALAAKSYIANGKFFPVPSELKALIPSVQSNSHLSADEAWAVAVRLVDEEDTVVYTQEIMDAYAAARPVLEMGDEVGARMAFRSAYERAPKSARPKWLVSRGNDKHLRLSRIQEAVSLGRLPASAIESVRIEQHGDTKALENQMDERLRLEGPESPISIDIEKAKKGISMLRGALSGGYAVKTSDAQVAAQQQLKNEQLDRALGGV